MSHYIATINWSRQDKETFTDNRYSRAHTWQFDGGEQIKASASPHIVPLPYSVEAHVDPEEAFVAAISSCHMLFFLSIAAKRRFTVDSYIDEAIGVMQADDNNKICMTDVTLRPKIIFSGEKQPNDEHINKMHHQAHQQCFIANSVTTTIHIQTRSP